LATKNQTQTTNIKNQTNLTYREQMLTLPAKSTTELNFPDTTPNYVHVNNYSGGTAYFGKSVYPSSTRYDMIVDGYGDNLYGSPNGFKKAYLYNDGADVVNLKIMSFEAPFEPSSLKGGGGTASSVSQSPASNGNVTVVGYNVPLPSGDNNIGRVIVSDMPAQTFTMDTLPAGTNNIGHVNVDILPPLAQGVSHIGTVGIDGGVTITSMPPVEVSNQPVKQSHQYYEGTVGDTTVLFDMAGDTVSQIAFLKNDGGGDLYVAFDGVDPNVAGNEGNGLNMRIHLLGGESLSDIPRKCGSVSFVRPAGGTGNVRFLGI
jgi:hypothetical protein